MTLFDMFNQRILNNLLNIKPVQKKVKIQNKPLKDEPQQLSFGRKFKSISILKHFFVQIGAVVSVGCDKGQAAIIKNCGIHSLCEVISKQIFQYEDATELMLALLSVRGHLCWSYHSAFDDFNSLMGKLCTDFANSQVRIL